MTSQGSETCAICLEDFGAEEGVQHAPTPCCERDASSVRFCLRCLELVCQSSPYEEAIANCPRCREFIRVEEGTVQRAQRPNGRCGMCCQSRILVNAHFCDACQMGREGGPLRYECNRCHEIQPISHPMYHYQEKPDSFGGATWACHMQCDDYTHWRIVSEDVNRVPADDIPHGWNVEDPIVALVRQLRLDEMNGGGVE